MQHSLALTIGLTLTVTIAAHRSSARRVRLTAKSIDRWR